MVGLDDLRGLFQPMILCFTSCSFPYLPLVGNVMEVSVGWIAVVRSAFEWSRRNSAR